MLQVRALHQFHGNIELPICGPGRINGNNVGVAHFRHEGTFFFKSGDTLRITTVAVFEQLDGQCAVKHQVSGLQHNAHAAHTEHTFQTEIMQYRMHGIHHTATGTHDFGHESLV